jgi:hypothetical protein
MASTYRPCCQCDTATRRRCIDCKRAVCQGCHVHGQCDECVGPGTFNQTCRETLHHHLKHASRGTVVSFEQYRGTADRAYHGFRAEDVA